MYVVDIVTVWNLSLTFATLIKSTFNGVLSIGMVTKKLQIAINTLKNLFIWINVTILGQNFNWFH